MNHYAIISELTGVPISDIHDDMIFGKDIHIDSIDFGEMLVKIHKLYPISSADQLFAVKTVSDLDKILSAK